MKKQIEEQLVEIMAQYQASDVSNACAYSLLGDGKRIRPLLMMALIKDYGYDPFIAMDAALALEMIQTYSIVHDDLPAMDDDDYRRGRLSNHKVFGEATAILAGDGLLTMAFETLALSGYSDDKVVKLVKLFADKSGINGMILGQSLDLKFEKQAVDSLEELLGMYDLKTGCLLTVALQSAAILVGKEKDLPCLQSIGFKCGRAFQIQDDIFDKTKTQEELGKTIGSDDTNQKTTALSFLSIEDATQLVSQYYREIREELSELKLLTSETYDLIEYLMARQR